MRMSKVLETYVTKRSRQKTIMYLTSMHAYSSLRLYWLAIMTRLTSSAIPGSIADAEGNQDARITKDGGVLITHRCRFDLHLQFS